MQVLTPTGYVDINDLNVGDEVVAYDINDGHLFTNILEAKAKWTHDMLPPVPPVYGEDEDGNPIILVPGKTSEEVFQETYGDWKFYLINGTWVLYCNQSVWANMNVVHASELQIGDIVYDDQNQDVTITSIEEVTAPDWWRLQISGDHSYIADNLTLHNASRYWVGGGSSSNWNATVNTNWGSSSGGPNNATIPSSVDDATFDGAGSNGNTNSTISADITILSLNITTGYTSTMTHNQILTIQGNWTYTGSYTIAGTNRITIGGTSTITSNGVTWPNDLTISTSTKTLVGDLTVNGLLTIGGSPVLNRTTTEKITVAGGLFSNSSTLSGTADIYLTGGTWSSANVNFTISSNLFLNGNITVSGGVACSGGCTLTYQSGTITTTGSTLNIGQGNYYVGAVTWNNITLISNNTITLVENLTALGTLSCQNNILNSNTLTCNGLTISTTLYGLTGTTKIILTGGTWSGNNTFSNPCDIQGNVTISGSVQRSGGTLTYVSGTVTTTGSTLTVNGNCTFNTNGIAWNNITCNNTTTQTLTSNLLVNGLFFASGNTTINSTTSETVTILNGLSLSNPLSGTASIYLKGGTWSSSITGAVLNSNLFIDGNVTIGAIASYGTRTLTYVSGTVTTTGSNFYINTTCTLNTNGITWNNFSNSGNAKTITLTSNITIGGLFTNTIAIINQSTTQTITCAGGLTTTGTLSGNAKMILTGGTWSGNSSTPFAQLAMTTEINGNITISSSASPSFNGSLKYISGTVTTTGSQLNIVNASTTTLDVAAVTWNIITGYNTVVSLVDNLILAGTLNTDGCTWNTSTGKTITANGLNVGSTSDTTGTAEIILVGGTWTSSTLPIRNALTFNGNVTVSGTVYYRTGPLKYQSGTITTTGSTLVIRDVTTLNTNGITWNNVTFATTGSIQTLTSNFAMSGLLTVSVATTLNTSVGATVTVAGGLTVNTALSGTAKIILTGGTWSSNGAVLSNSLDINGNVTIGANVYYGTNTLTYVSGTVTTTGSILWIGSSCTLNTNGIVWNGLYFNGGNTTTLTSNVSCALIAVNNATTINTANSSTVTASNGIVVTSAIGGSAKLILTGGTWSGASALSNTLDINGNVTISGSVSYGGSALTYLSGTVSTSGSTVDFTATTTITSGAIQWWNVTHSTFNANKTLVGDMVVRGLFFNNSNGGLINKTTNEKVIIFGGLNIGSFVLDGTAPFYISGGTWFGTSNVSVPLVIDGDIIISGSVAKINTTLTYLSGRVRVSNAILNLSQTIGIRGRIDKIPFTSIVISAGANISFDYFFSGTPSRICTVSSTGANYNVSFTDGFEKIARNVAITGATVARPLQLIVINNPKFNTNRGTNSQGIRYVNQSPNGSPKGSPSAIDTMTVPALGLVGDPCFQRQ